MLYLPYISPLSISLYTSPLSPLYLQLCGIVDLLRHVKDISLYLQSVNRLPWEIETRSSAFISLLYKLADELEAGKTDYTLPATDYSDGKRVRALQYLSLHRPQIENLKLTLTDKDSNEVQSTKLLLQAETRRSTSRLAVLFRGTDGLPITPPTASDEVKAALKDLAKMAKKMAEALADRLTPPGDEFVYLLAMSKCLDFTKMIGAGGEEYASEDKAKRSLLRLYNWMATRFVVAPQPQAMAIDAEEVEEEVVKPMPSFDVVWAQYTTLAQRLREAATLPAYSRWSGASGTVIMKNVFTEPRFYSKVGDFLYIWLHMATKSMCEAVIEGMGGVWDRSNRHGSWETAIEEAVVAWNSPQPYHPAAIPFVNHALTQPPLQRGGQMA